MRDIKFRAWDRRKKEMIYIKKDIFLHFDFGGWYLNNDKNSNGEEILPTSGDNSYLMQWTGLNDKLGNPIYENDLVRLKVESDTEDPLITHGIFEVIYNQYVWAFKNETDYIPLGQYNTMTLQEYDLEIIGNIYESPELLNN